MTVLMERSLCHGKECAKVIFSHNTYAKHIT